MAGRRNPKDWTAAGAARAARQARIATVAFQREALIARMWQATKLLNSFQTKVAHLGGHQTEAALLLFTGMGYHPETWRPGNWVEAAEHVLADQAHDMAAADLYVLSPQMCDVVVAAAQTLTAEDLSLLAADDLPSSSGLVVLPHPLLVRAIDGNMGDDRAYLWHSPVGAPYPDPATRKLVPKPAVRISLYLDAHGPVRPDSFMDYAAEAASQRTPLPPLTLDAVRCLWFEHTFTDDQRRNHQDFAETAKRTARQARDTNRVLGFEEERVTGEYTPGSEITDTDGSFSARFLYAFWRLCEQRIAVAEPAEINHSAQVAAQRAGVAPDVRVVRLRQVSSHVDDQPTEGGRQWQHRWIVRMHKVRQWYPSEHRHKVLYRGPFLKGPQDKPLLGGETVRGLVR